VARHLAIGDIHGCINALTTLVRFVAFRHDDIIVTPGDYIDRGLDSREKKSWFQPWLSYGGEATLRSYAPSEDSAGTFADVPESHFDFLENKLLSYYECDSHFFVHAYADPNTALADQTDPTLYWRKYGEPERHCSGKIMVCGHTPQSSGLPASNGHSTGDRLWSGFSLG
jgi:serine/threonine protein phosphatase 1